MLDTELEHRLLKEELNNSTESEMKRILRRQKAEFRHSPVTEKEIRVDRLDRAIELLVDNADRIDEALQEDWSRPRFMNMLAEVGGAIARLKYARKNLHKWCKPRRVSPDFPFGILGAKAKIESRPLGAVGIVSPWNAPSMLSFGPLAAVFAAGNSAMIKPSEHVPTFAELLKTLVKKYFGEHELAVITGGADAGIEFTQLPFDHLVFTGGSSIAKNVLQAAANNLTPVTLELGGKSPVVIDASADIKRAALRIVSGKCLNAGQICVSPDYVFVPEQKLEEFLCVGLHVAKEQFPTIVDNDDYGSIINKKHFQRLTSYLDDARDRQVRIVAVEEVSQEMEGALKLPLHFVVNPPEDASVSQEEAFGPILTVLSYSDKDQVINFINARPHPLALYFFGEENEFRNKLLSTTMAGDVTINDVLFHSSQCALPFGGVGNSGDGSCYGEAGFHRLSYQRSIYQQTRIDSVLNMMRPPYTQKTLKSVMSMIKK
ncbi:aldehyde dehydrogenase family protein [Pseudomaricurvus alkylphenolicus]|uniref:aldehyde dehydrogenase family protein n=1 Tax=Pseudomaricurvus alkylphenolicus TaxID=1306991 RepID=UPI00141FAF63|nr:aldehyde dehydrogenase family protein [Pseudomaricurvus alkylphenolicus]NIB38706.1 aldehyde dehydrogenase family protein [Pseudomaricurvus alkylphenolicus]